MYMSVVLYHEAGWLCRVRNSYGDPGIRFADVNEHK